MPHDCGIAEFFIHRLIRMSKRLGSFANLILGDQIDLLQHNIIDMLVIRSVLLYDPDREAFCFLDVSNFYFFILNIIIIIIISQTTTEINHNHYHHGWMIFLFITPTCSNYQIIIIFSVNDVFRNTKRSNLGFLINLSISIFLFD